MSRVRAPDGAPKEIGANEQGKTVSLEKWLVGQAVKTPASHAGNGGSIPPRVTIEVGVDDAEGPPVPIPNTEVKLSGAEDTWLVTARENREMPTSKCPPNRVGIFSFMRNFLSEKIAVKNSDL